MGDARRPLLHGTALLALCLSLGGCVGLAVVEPGHRAVAMSPEGNFSLLDEGVSSVPPDAVVDDFDLRQLNEGGTFVAITADGVPIAIGDPVVSYGWIAQELIDADRALSREAARGVVAATVGSAISRVLATYRWDELDPNHIREAQAKIIQLAAEALRPRHLLLASVELKGIYPKLPQLAQAVTETSVWEQRSQTAKTGVELAKQRADGLRTSAAGIAAANADIAPTLTPPVLQDKRNQAWLKLLTAPTTTVEVTSGTSPSIEVSP